MQYSAQEVEALKAECKETINNLKEKRENATKMALEQAEALHKAELQREVLQVTNEANAMIAVLKNRNEQLAKTIDSLNSKIAEPQNPLFADIDHRVGLKLVVNLTVLKYSLKAIQKEVPPFQGV